jgi:RND family efflux transporter MFP subunit
MQLELETKTQIVEKVRTPLIARQPGPSRNRKRYIALGAILLAAASLVFGIVPRVKAKSTLRADNAALAVPTVSVVRPERSAPAQEIVLPGNIQAYSSAPIYARTNGYLKRWYVDIGSRVKKGQLLAEIETPELDQQLQQARAQLATAQANLKLSQITANRYQDLLKTNSVAQQDTDNAVGAFNANQATVQASEHNVKQLEELQSFEKIYAPFDGVITARNTDVGALINSGSTGGPAASLFSIAQGDRLRVYVSVPEAYSQAAKPGLTADLTLAEFPGRHFQGKLVRTADAIDQTNRTLLTEIEVNNPTGVLLTGAYAEVHLKLPATVSSYVVPVNTLLFRSEGLRVATVKDNKVSLVAVTPGHDFGDRMEIASGLNGDEQVIVNPPDSILAGEQVQVQQSNSDGGRE